MEEFMNANEEKIAVLFLHPACNMSCTFCITDNALDTMTFAQAQEVLAVARSRSMTNVVFGGGEPFAWPHDMLRLAGWAKSQGHFVQVGTNGISMPEEPAYVDVIDRYVLPLDAAEASIHNQSRRYGAGHHGLVLGRMEALRHAGKSVTVSTVVTTRNSGHLEGIAELLNDYAARGGRLHAWHLYKFIPEGRGGATHADELDIAEAAYDAACARVKDRCAGFRVFKRKDMRHSRSVDFFWMEDGVLRTGSEVWVKESTS